MFRGGARARGVLQGTPLALGKDGCWDQGVQTREGVHGEPVLDMEKELGLSVFFGACIFLSCPENALLGEGERAPCA